MKKILIIGPYPPLFSHGGPTRSVRNLYKILSKNNIVKVLSPGRHINGKRVNLLKKDIVFSDNHIIYILKNINEFDIIWHNSFFNVKTLILAFLGFFFNYKLIISPRGELSKEAINTSRKKLKNIFIYIFNFFNPIVNFHVTSSDEHIIVSKKFKNSNIKLIPNLFNLKFFENRLVNKKFIFYSRIHKKKGLLIILDYLISLNQNIYLDIYGFIEDEIYWHKCLEKLKYLKNARYMGPLNNGDISELKNKYSFFLFPTLNENYGHVIVEMLSIGLIPVVSKGTNPFDELLNSEINLNFNLYSFDDFKLQIEKIIDFNESKIFTLKKRVKQLFNKLVEDQSYIINEYIIFINNLSK